MTIKIVAIEDHPLMLKAVLQELQGHPDLEIVGTGAHGSELFRLVQQCVPDVVILDLGMNAGGFEPVGAVQALRRMHPQVQILVLTGYDDGAWIRHLIAAGARGYVLKSDDLSLCLAEGVRTLYRGGEFYSPNVALKYFARESLLSAQEVAILRLVAQGFSNGHIAHELGLSEKTVRNSLSTIYSKLNLQLDENINLRVAAVARAREMGLIK